MQPRLSDFSFRNLRPRTCDSNKNIKIFLKKVKNLPGLDFDDGRVPSSRVDAKSCTIVILTSLPHTHGQAERQKAEPVSWLIKCEQSRIIPLIEKRSKSTVHTTPCAQRTVLTDSLEARMPSTEASVICAACRACKGSCQSHHRDQVTIPSHCIMRNAYGWPGNANSMVWASAQHRVPPSGRAAGTGMAGTAGGGAEAASSATPLFSAAASTKGERVEPRKERIYIPIHTAALIVVTTLLLGSAVAADQELSCTSDQGLHYITGPSNEDVSHSQYYARFAYLLLHCACFLKFFLFILCLSP